MPNPNQAFISIIEIIDSQYTDVDKAPKRQKVVEIDSEESEEEGGDMSDMEEIAPPIAIRSRR